MTTFTSRSKTMRAAWWAICLAGSAGCQSVICGSGTFEVNGVCIASDGGLPRGTCGAGTTYDPITGVCKNIEFTDSGSTATGLCGENTSRVFNDAGEPVCVGTGGTDCDSKLPCESPDSDKVSICGRIYDTETTKPVGDGSALPPLSIKFFDPIEFNDKGSLSEVKGTGAIDKCGRYSAKNVSRPGTGFLALAVDDEGAPQVDVYALTAVPMETEGGQVIGNLVGFITKRETLRKWNDSAGLKEMDVNGNPYIEHQGIYMPIFIDTTKPPVPPFRGTPVVGVQVTVGGTTKVDPADEYFDDTDPLSRTNLKPAQAATGPNGSGILLHASLGTYSGKGAEPDKCMWPATPAGTYAPNDFSGVVLVQQRESICPE
jgi:hypothetical protein